MAVHGVSVSVYRKRERISRSESNQDGAWLESGIGDQRSEMSAISIQTNYQNSQSHCSAPSIAVENQKSFTGSRSGLGDGGPLVLV